MKNVSTVEQVVSSINEGADFIAEAICERQAGKLQQEVSQRMHETLTGGIDYGDDAQRDIDNFIEIVPFLIRRAARISIFATRQERLGL